MGRFLRRSATRGGKSKIASEEAIVCDVARAAGDQPLAGEHIVVTAGATSESIDPVRVLTNRSSGTMGRAVAKACYVRGADVTLVQHGADVPYADVRQVEHAAEMLEATQDACQHADTLVSAAAIGDYTVEPSDEKIRSGQDLTLELEPAPKLIDEVREARPELPIVGFKAETSGDDGAMIEQARQTLERADLAFVVANDASVMGETDTRALLVHASNAAEYEGSKAGLGAEIASSIAVVLGDHGE